MTGSRRRVLVLAGCVLAAGLLLAFGHACARFRAAPDGHLLKGGDFFAFYDAGEAALRHGDVYAAGPRMRMNVFYAPHFSLLMAPFALLPPSAAAWIWYLLKLGAVAWLVRWLDRTLRREAPGGARRARLALLALPFLAALNPFLSEFRLGQANLFVLLSTVLMADALARGRPLRAALWFSLAVVKITPLALLPWLAFRRQWRFFLALVPVAAAWLGALAAWWGPAAVPDLFRQWIRVTATLKAVPEVIAYHENQSLQGAAARLAAALPVLQRPVLGLAASQWLWIAPCGAIVLLLGIVAARDRFRPRLLAEELALASLLMLLASTDSRYAHHVQLFAPLAVLAALSARAGWLERLPWGGGWLSGGAPPPAGEVPAARALRRRLSILWGATFAFYVALGRDTFGPAVNHLARTLSLGTALDLALLAFLARRLLRPPDEPLAAPVRALSGAAAEPDLSPLAARAR